jgi:enoyl-CoA hydratase
VTGAALELVASCDMRVATDDATFSMPEVAIGIPSVVEAARLPLLVGWGRARRLVYTGEHLSASKALSWGLVEEVVAGADELDRHVTTLAQTIAEAGPRAMRLQKELIHQWESNSVNDAVLAGIPVFGRAFETDEPSIMMDKVLKGLKR